MEPGVPNAMTEGWGSASSEVGGLTLLAGQPQIHGYRRKRLQRCFPGAGVEGDSGQRPTSRPRIALPREAIGEPLVAAREPTTSHDSGSQASPRTVNNSLARRRVPAPAQPGNRHADTPLLRAGRDVDRSPPPQWPTKVDRRCTDRFGAIPHSSGHTRPGWNATTPGR